LFIPTKSPTFLLLAVVFIAIAKAHYPYAKIISSSPFDGLTVHLKQICMLCDVTEYECAAMKGYLSYK